MASATVEISQFGQLLGTTTTDERGIAKFSGHDPFSTCEVGVSGFACLAEKGAAPPGPEPFPQPQTDTASDGASGCDLDDGAFVEPQPPQL